MAQLPATATKVTHIGKQEGVASYVTHNTMSWMARLAGQFAAVVPDANS